MEYHLITDEGRNGGVTGTEPTHNNWTLTPYLGGLIREKYDDETDAWIESATEEEIEDFNNDFKNELNKEYTKLISDLVEKHVQKNIIDGTPIPQEILDERERLKEEYNQLKQQIKYN